MNFVRKVIMAGDQYTSFVDEQSERLVEIVFENAAKAADTARTQNIRTPLSHRRPVESHFITALIEKLQDAGF